MINFDDTSYKDYDETFDEEPIDEETLEIYLDTKERVMSLRAEGF
jgi:hypothetical protein